MACLVCRELMHISYASADNPITLQLKYQHFAWKHVRMGIVYVLNKPCLWELVTMGPHQHLHYGRQRSNAMNMATSAYPVSFGLIPPPAQPLPQGRHALDRHMHLRDPHHHLPQHLDGLLLLLLLRLQETPVSLHPHHHHLATSDQDV